MTLPALPPLHDQHARLLDLGLEVPALPAGLTGDLLVVHPRHTPAEVLAGLLRLDGRHGFVVEDLTDLADFGPAPGVQVPDADLYAVHGPSRGDDLAGVTPNEAGPRVRSAGRDLMTVYEGLCWALQAPQVIERHHCFMTAGSRRAGSRPGRLDARVPALWISNGTGRDGAEHRGAPKLGWCWAGNHHTWLGIASVAGRSG